MNRTIAAGLIALLLGAAAGCHDDLSPKNLDIAAVTTAHQAVRERVDKRFSRAAFLSPHTDSQVDLPLWMAPLIVEQLGEAAGAANFTRFGELAADPERAISVDTDRLTVYVIAADVVIGERSMQQLTSFWLYPSLSRDGVAEHRGVRMLLDERGFGIVWEALSSDAQLREFYVSKSLERDARAAFGPPLPGRKFTVEPPLNDHPEVLVVRAISDGPQPMGPFVCLARGSLSITTLLCRCEPSQVDEFPQSTDYQWVQLSSLAELPGQDGTSARKYLPQLESDWTQVLRLPGP